MKIVCTICSKEKSSAPGNIPARERYIAPHIRKTEEIARERQARFFILSGFFGLVEDTHPVPAYDYRLESPNVSRLAKQVVVQLYVHNITHVEFYTEGKESWQVYEQALELAAKEARVILTRYLL